MPNLYEWLARRSWRKDDFAIEPSAWSRWAEPEVAEEPAALRERLRTEMERIAQVEGEPMKTTTKEAVAGMKLAKFVKFREEKFGGVLFETRQEKVYTLNPTGAAIVKEIIAGARDIVGQLKSKFDCGCKEDCIEPEVGAFVADLKAKGLLVE